jgi:cardiolipin synthase
MKKIYRLLYSNKFVAMVMLLMQIITFVAMYIWISDYSKVLFGLSTVLSAVLIIFEINRTEESTFKMTWITLIAIIPIFGALFYLFTRAQGVSMNIGDDYKNIQEANKKYLVQDEDVMKNIYQTDKNQDGFARYLSKYGGSPAYTNTGVQYYSIGERMFEDMKKELLKAEKFIFLEFFIINHTSRMWNEILEILKKKVKQGVEVRVMYDGMGCIVTLPRKYNEYLERQGIKCRIFSPIVPLLSTHQNNRDHRKIMVIDGATAFCGGINISDEYINEKMRFGHWKDTGFMLRGEAVAGFTAMFLEMWNAIKKNLPSDRSFEPYLPDEPYKAVQHGYVQPYADSPLDDEQVGEEVYISMANKAEHYCWFITPYLIITDELSHALSLAAKRGVDVRIITPGIPDKKMVYSVTRSFYHQLVSSGVHIFEWAPGFCHAKMSIADDRMATCGTINLDYRSLYHHFENGCFMVDCPAVMDIKHDFRHTFSQCRDVTEKYKTGLGAHLRLGQLILRLFAQLL